MWRGAGQSGARAKLEWRLCASKFPERIQERLSSPRGHTIERPDLEVHISEKEEQTGAMTINPPASRRRTASKANLPDENSKHHLPKHTGVQVLNHDAQHIVLACEQGAPYQQASADRNGFCQVHSRNPAEWF